MSEEPLVTSSRSRPHNLYYLLILLTAAILATSVVIVYNNSFRSAPLYLFLLLLGVALISALGQLTGGLFGLLLISAWITLKQTTGVWSEARLSYNLLEMLMAALTFIVSGVYHDRLKAFLEVYTDYQSKLKQLDLEDKAIGLIKSPVGLLRLREEEDRSVRYRRPFSLVLILLRPAPEVTWGPKDSNEVMRAIATAVKDTTRDVDIPFLAAPDQIAVILPETGTTGANKVVSNVVKQIITARFITQSGSTVLLREYAQVRFGFATFLGKSNGQINLLEAAQHSLQLNLETNVGDLFHNLFIEWATVGESHVSSPVFGHEAPTVISGDEKMEKIEVLTMPETPAPEEQDAKAVITRLINYLRSL